MAITRICAVVCEASTDAALSAMRSAAAGADIIELRADYIQDLDLPRLLTQRPRPVIFTCRPVRHGGRFSGRESERLAILRAAVRAGAEYVDVEDDVDSSSILAPAETGRGIVSYHNFDHTPDDLEAIYRRLGRMPAGVVKIATQANSLRDAGRVHDLLLRHGADARPLIACAMGARGLFTRVLGPHFGSFLTYASLGEGRASAPGQLSLSELTDLYRIRRLDADTRIVGLLGTPLGHSLSSVIHNAAFRALDLDYIYLPFDADDLGDFFRLAEKLPLYGFSVTVPHKVGVRPYLSSVDAVAAAVGAVNTVVRTPSGWAGHNTDVDGFLAPILINGSLPYRSAVIIGAGGAARAAVYGLLRHGVSVRVIARRMEKAAALAHALGADYAPWSALGEPADLLVNTTPVGMYPHGADTPVPSAFLANKQAVYDLVYNPYRTRLLEEAAAAGRTVIHGLDMFVAQAALQFRIWTGQAAPADLMRSRARDRLLSSSGES